MPATGILYTGFTLYWSIFAVYLVTGIERFHCTTKRAGNDDRDGAVVPFE